MHRQTSKEQVLAARAGERERIEKHVQEQRKVDLDEDNYAEVQEKHVEHYTRTGESLHETMMKQYQKNNPRKTYRIRLTQVAEL